MGVLRTTKDRMTNFIIHVGTMRNAQMDGASLAKSEKYRRVSMRFSARQGGVADAVQAINAHADPDDFYVACNGEREIEIWLRQVDMDGLRAALDSADDFPRLASRILERIEEVGSYGISNGKRVYVGYDQERKVADRKKKELRRGRHYYANDADFDALNTSLPGQFRNAILCGDSEEVLMGLPDNCIDLVFTSPPYNFGLDYRGPDDNAGINGDGDARDWESYFEKLFRVFDQCIRVLKYGGRIIVNVQPLFSDYIPSHHIISNYFIQKKLIWKGEILWEKNNYNCKYTAWGSWKSPSSPYLKYTWEFLEVFCKGDLKKPGSAANADIDPDSFKRWVYGRWSIAPERNMSRYGHPAVFPEELARRAMLLFSFRKDMVLDPFAGVGTTCAVAQQSGRDYLGIDIISEYCKTARMRLAGTP